jgi:flagellar motor switch protein FliM
LRPELDILEVNPQFMQLVSPNETVAVVSLSSKIGETTGMINVCMPHVVLEPIMPKLSAHYWMNPKKSRDNSKDSEAIRNTLQKAYLPVAVELGTSSISVGEFLQLAVGDVIKLDNEVSEKVEIKIGQNRKYLGQPGVSRGRIAVQVTEILEEGVMEDDE